MEFLRITGILLSVSTIRRVHYTYAEYLALEEESSIHHEYLDGEIYAVAGGSPDHAALAAAIISAIRSKLPPGCRMFTSDLRIRIPATGLSAYPDAAVVCGRTQRAEDDALAVVNPLLLVEVTSPSTEEYDRNEKLRHYRSLPSLREVAIASHREPHLTLHRRDESGWTVATAGRGGALTLVSVAVRLEVREVYRDELEDCG
jgi:Uma2 family endonuclease